AGLRAGDQLAGEHQLESDVVTQCGQDRLVGGQRPGRQGVAERRSREQGRQRGGIGAAAAVSEREQPAAGGEPPRQLGGGPRQQIGVGFQRGAPKRQTFGRLGLCRRGQIGEQRGGIVFLGVDERVQEVGGFVGGAHETPSRSSSSPTWSNGAAPRIPAAPASSSQTRLIAVPACTSTSSPDATGSTRVVTTSSTPRAVRTVA